MADLDFAPQESKQVQVQISRLEIIEGARTNLDFLASMILTDIFAYGYPPILKSMWQIVTTSLFQSVGKFRYALGIPRGFSKTIWLKLMVVWAVLFTERRFILIVCATEGHAANFISDVAAMLSHPNVVRVFGDWKNNIEKDTGILKNFEFRGRKIIIGGIGAGGSPRGLNINFVRPDFVVMDDMQKKEEAANLELAEELMVWMLGTLMKACDPHVCTYVFVANMYPYEGSILRKLKNSKEWISYITGAITADGKSIWPEHRDVPDLLEELRVDEEQGHPEVFFSEVMNDEEAGTVSGIDVSKFRICPEGWTAEAATGGFVLIDPSLGKKKSDNVAIGAVLIFDGVPVLWEVDEGKYDPGQTIQQATMMAVRYNMALIVCEGVAYQATLAYWFTYIFAQMGIEGIEARTILPDGMPKNSRIRDWMKTLLSGKTYISQQVRNRVVYQATQWNPLKTNNVDDVLDIGAYMLKCMNENQDRIAFIIDVTTHVDLPPASFGAELSLAF